MAGAARRPRALLPGLGSIVQDTGAALTQGIGDGIGDLTSGLGVVTSGIGSITSDLGSGVSTVLSPILPTTTSSSTTSTTTTSSATDTSTTSSESSTSLTSSSTTSSVPSSSVSTPAASTPLADNGQHTVTATVSSTDTGSIAPTSSPAPTSFLQNKPLAGAVFGIVGVLVLIAVFLLATFALRRRRRRKLTEEAISFEPSEPHYEDYGEKGRTSMGSNSSHAVYQYPAAVPANPYSGQQQRYYPQSGNAAHSSPPFGPEGRHSPSPGLKIANP